MKRKIIQINEELCNGCGLCVPNCQEGALQIIDGKARLVSDLFCDGLGACIGHCPEGAIEVIEREAAPYDEVRVMEVIVPKGRNTILAHLEHLRDHGETGYLETAIRYLKEHQIDMSPDPVSDIPVHNAGCPGARQMDFRIDAGKVQAAAIPVEETSAGPPSELRQWPVQLHLLNPLANYFREAAVVLAADCAAFAMGDFHQRYLKGKSIAIACPKLDINKDAYVEKLTAMIRDSGICSLTVVMMEVPCCGGLLQFARMAREAAGSDIAIRKAVISIRGELISEEKV